MRGPPDRSAFKKSNVQKQTDFNAKIRLRRLPYAADSTSILDILDQYATAQVQVCPIELLSCMLNRKTSLCSQAIPPCVRTRLKLDPLHYVLDFCRALGTRATLVAQP